MAENANTLNNNQKQQIKNFTIEKNTKVHKPILQILLFYPLNFLIAKVNPMTNGTNNDSKPGRSNPKTRIYY